jgi:hypothetical protein
MSYTNYTYTYTHIPPHPHLLHLLGEVFHNTDDEYRPESAKILLSALSLLGLYYLVLKPFRLLPVDLAMTKKYNEAELHPRFSYFEVWYAGMLVCWYAGMLVCNMLIFWYAGMPYAI